MNAIKEELLKEAYEKFYLLMLYDFPTERSSECMDVNIMGYGTTVDEKILSIEGAVALAQKQRDQGLGLDIHFEKTAVTKRISESEDAAIFVDELLITINAAEGTNVVPARITTIFYCLEGQWKAVHWHGSTPVDTENDTWHQNEWKKKNEELQRLVDEKTAELKKSLDQLRATQSQLIHAEKMASLGELTAGIAHEIQNPLNFVNNFSEINTELIEDLKEAVAGNEQKEVEAILKNLTENEQKVSHHGKRAEQIVRSMLQHSRASEGKKELTDINALCDEYLRLAFHGFRAKSQSAGEDPFQCDYTLDLDPTLPMIQAVPQDIGRVLLNLINNAFQAVSEVEKPSVVVATRKLDQVLEITISDNGPGIPDEIKDKIFQPFFTTKPTGQGTGLGLSLSYDIVRAHGGELTVTSEEGTETELLIQLPIS